MLVGSALWLAAASIAAGFALGWLGPWLTRLERRLPPADVELLRELAAFAVPLIERRFPELAGAEKLAQAVRLVTDAVRRRGLSAAAEEVEAAVERAWAEAEASGRLTVYRPASDLRGAKRRG
jgi:NhaP-type Na+/H+ or K+/H+ antiporter